MVASTDLGNLEELLDQAKAELTDVAVTIDGWCEGNMSMELIEATRAIHGALVALGALDDFLRNGSPASLRTQVGMPFNRVESPAETSPRPPSPASPSISILYDDLLVPMKVVSKGGGRAPTDVCSKD